MLRNTELHWRQAMVECSVLSVFGVTLLLSYCVVSVATQSHHTVTTMSPWLT